LFYDASETDWLDDWLELLTEDYCEEDELESLNDELFEPCD
jgi:hypothetical protein